MDWLIVIFRPVAIQSTLEYCLTITHSFRHSYTDGGVRRARWRPAGWEQLLLVQCLARLHWHLAKQRRGLNQQTSRCQATVKHSEILTDCRYSRVIQEQPWIAYTADQMQEAFKRASIVGLVGPFELRSLVRGGSAPVSNMLITRWAMFPLNDVGQESLYWSQLFSAH